MWPGRICYNRNQARADRAAVHQASAERSASSSQDDPTMPLTARFALCTLLFAFCALASAATSQTALDAAARARLVGQHRLTLQWLGWNDLGRSGKLVIEDRGDTLSVLGEQSGQGENLGDYLKITGNIISVTKDGFIFTGNITTRVGHIADGVACKRSGTFTFKTKGTRKYWRMQEMDNPCDPVTDYVDVYFRGI
jgi:hypothetical protein